MMRRRPLERAFAFLAGDLNCCRSDEAHISDQTLNQLAATGKFPADENTFSASSFFSGEKTWGAGNHDDDISELSFWLERNLVEVSFMSHKKQQCRYLHNFFRQRLKSVLHGRSGLW